jgi:hypothetical protein
MGRGLFDLPQREAPGGTQVGQQGAELRALTIEAGGVALAPGGVGGRRSWASVCSSVYPERVAPMDPEGAIMKMSESRHS